MDFNSFKTDSVMENEGVWVPCGSGKILVASTASDRYRKALAKALEPHELSIALKEDLDENVSKEMFITLFAEHILLDWDGFTEGGQPCPYTKENAKRLMASAARFRDFVKQQADSIDNFRIKKEAVETKNSQTA